MIVVFDNDSESKQDITRLLNIFYITHICDSFKNQQSNTPAEGVHQVIYNMLVTKDFDNFFYDYIYPLGDTLALVA